MPFYDHTIIGGDHTPYLGIYTLVVGTSQPLWLNHNIFVIDDHDRPPGWWR